MSTSTTCRTCGQPYALVMGTAKAHPGTTVTNGSARGEVYDIDGVKVPGAGYQGTDSRFVSAGPSARVRHENISDTYAEAVWTCLCGADVRYTYLRVYVVECLYGATKERPTCRKRANLVNPPLDLHVNPSYGAACACCGQSGTHRVHWGETAACGAAARHTIQRENTTA